MPANFAPGWFAKYLYRDEDGDLVWLCVGCGQTYSDIDGNREPETDCADGLLCEDCAEKRNDEDDTPAPGFSLGAMTRDPGTIYGG